MIKYIISFIIVVFIILSCSEPKKNFNYIFEDLSNSIEVQALVKKTDSKNYVKSLSDVVVFREEYQKCDIAKRSLFEKNINVNSKALESCSLIVDEIIFDSFINFANGINVNIDSLTKVHEIRCQFRTELRTREAKREREVMNELTVQNDSRCMVGDTLDLFFAINKDADIRPISCFLSPNYLAFSRQVYMKVILSDKEYYESRDVPNNQVDEIIFKCTIIEMNFPFIHHRGEQLRENDVFIFSLKNYCHFIN